MSEPRLYIRSGEEVEYAETSRHHVFSREHFNVKNPKPARRLMAMGRAVIRMYNPYHNETDERNHFLPTALHHNVDNMQRPDIELIKDMYGFLSHLPANVDKLEGLDRLSEHLHHLGELAITEHTHNQVIRTADNLDQQLPYIKQGAVYRGV